MSFPHNRQHPLPGPLSRAELARLAELLDRYLAHRNTGSAGPTGQLSADRLRVEIATAAGVTR